MNTKNRTKAMAALAAGAVLALMSAAPTFGQEQPGRKTQLVRARPPVFDSAGLSAQGLQGPCDCDNWVPGPVIKGRRKPPIDPGLP